MFPQGAMEYEWASSSPDKQNILRKGRIKKHYSIQSGTNSSVQDSEPPRQHEADPQLHNCTANVLLYGLRRFIGGGSVVVLALLYTGCSVYSAAPQFQVRHGISPSWKNAG